jgi:hypothetical protein
MYNDWIGRTTWPLGLILSCITVILPPIGTVFLVLHNPCLYIFTSSVIIPCDAAGNAHIWTDLGQLSIAILVGVIEGYFIGQLLTSGIMSYVHLSLFSVLSLRTYLLEAMAGTGYVY